MTKKKAETTSYDLILPGHWLGQRINVAIVGCGGNGSAMADALGSMLATFRALDRTQWQVTLFDSDYVSEFNVGRQRFTMHDVGHNKAVVLAFRINAFYGLTWKAMPVNAKPQDLADKFDLIVSCVDKAKFRAELGKALGPSHKEVIFLDLGVGPTSGQVICGHLHGRRGSALADKTRRHIPNVADLYPNLADMTKEDREAPSCSTEEALRRQSLPVNRIAADCAIDMLYHLVREGRLPYHGVQFLLNPMRATPMPCDPVSWSMYGYEVDGRKAA